MVATKKRLVELETRLTAEEKKSKQLSRERDAAVTALAHSHGQLASRIAQSQETVGLRQKDTEDLHRRAKQLEECCKALEVERNALLAAHAQVTTTPGE